MPATRRAMQEKIKEVGTWIAAAFLGVGVAMSLTVVFLPGGMLFVFLGATLGTLSWGLSYLLPVCFRYRTIVCPYCRQINQVRLHVLEYNCDGCGHRMPGEAFWRRPNRHSTGKKQPPRGGQKVVPLRRIS